MFHLIGDRGRLPQRRLTKRVIAALCAVAVLGAPGLASAGSAPPDPTGQYSARPHPATSRASKLDTTCPTTVTGTNPSLSAVGAIIDQVAANHHMPAQVLKAIAYTESGWRQYRPDGSIVLSADGYCGIGIMQLTHQYTFDQTRLASDIAYNIDAGAQILDQAWARSVSSDPASIGMDDRSIIENWYYPIYFYNGANGSSTYPDMVVNRLRSPATKMAEIAPYDPPLAFTRPQDVLPTSYTMGSPFQARPNDTFITYTSDGTITGTYPGTIHHWGNGITAFVDAAYTDFLDRMPTDAEITAAGTVPRDQFLAGLAGSPEWVSTIVNDLYKNTLGRTGDAGGVAYWTNLLGNGTMTVADVAANFYASDEYFNGLGGGTNSSWITDLYQKILGRSADAGGLNWWLGQASNRVAVAWGFFQSIESANDRVAALYQKLLGRAPDPGGSTYWSMQVINTGDITLAINLAMSPEYDQRAQVRFPPT